MSVRTIVAPEAQWGMYPWKMEAERRLWEEAHRTAFARGAEFPSMARRAS
jgi:hypothetical protein